MGSPEILSYDTNIQKLSKKFRRSVSWSKSREEGVESSVMSHLSDGNIIVLLHLNAPQRDLTAKKQFHFEY